MSDLEKAIRYICYFNTYNNRNTMVKRYLIISDLVKDDNGEKVLEYAKRYEKLLDLLDC